MAPKNKTTLNRNHVQLPDSLGALLPELPRLRPRELSEPRLPPLRFSEYRFSALREMMSWLSLSSPVSAERPR
jgi:hypothetical protein